MCRIFHIHFPNKCPVAFSGQFVVCFLFCYFGFWWFENLFPWSNVLYGTFHETMSDPRVLMCLLLGVVYNFSHDLAWSRYYMWKQDKREALAIKQELERGS